MEDQEKFSTRVPPRVGPTRDPEAGDGGPDRIAFARSAGLGKMVVRIERVAGITRAAPAPMTARAATSAPVEPETAARTEPAANTTSPVGSARWRP